MMAIYTSESSVTTNNVQIEVFLSSYALFIKLWTLFKHMCSGILLVSVKPFMDRMVGIHSFPFSN